ncbi:protease SohB [Moraxella caviae]|uniref:protease SohB n=1 Tax=Moraxella caviae TaxID=34060 RepID=UPI001FEB6DFD
MFKSFVKVFLGKFMLFHSAKKPVELQIIHLNRVQKERKEHLEKAFNAKDEKGKSLLAKLCAKRKELKEKDQDDSTLDKDARSVFVLDFEGDIKASAVNHLRDEISTIISTAKAGDEVVVRLESGGGQVNAYGLAAAQLARLKTAGLTLTVCVDKIAASGGYMMACTADRIIASDFGVIGSIGVVSQLPNFHKLLQKHDIDYELFTAGEYKRTVTLFGENSDDDRAKYQADLERIHVLFQEFVAKHRPKLDVAKVATGEFWFGTDALALGLIDEIGTSDAYLVSLLDKCNVFLLQSRSKPTLAEKLGLAEQLHTNIKGAFEQAVSAVPDLLAKLSRP